MRAALLGRYAYQRKKNPYHNSTDGRFASAEGGEGSTIATTIDGAIKLLGKGKGVMFTRPEHAVTLLHKLAEMAIEAKAAGKDAKVYDLCKVSVKGTNLFCGQNVGIARKDMPQLKGIPLPGTPADKLPKNARGSVDLGPAFRDFLTAQGHTIEDVSEPASHLRASQTELDGARVAEIVNILEGPPSSKKPSRVFISKENYIIDGHHRWAATVGHGLGTKKDIPMEVSRISVPILQALKMANDFTAAMGLPKSAVGE